MRIKFNDKIYRLKEIESGVDSLMELVEEPKQKYKEGDFLTTVSGSCFILKNICGSKVYDHAFLAEDGLDWDNGICCDLDDIAGYCTQEEKLKVIAALKKDGKRWNAEKKCIEDIPAYRSGDILVKEYKTGSKYIFILDRISEDNTIHYHCYHSPTYHRTEVKPDFGIGRVGDIYHKCLRYAEDSEKELLFAELAEIGKRWNDDKKCIEDKFKAGDKVRIKDGISSNSQGGVYPYFEGFLDQYIGKVMTVKKYITTDIGEYITTSEAKRGGHHFGFAEDWLEPWSDEPKVGDWVIYWDSIQTAKVGILACIRPDERYKYVVDDGDWWRYAVKWNGTKEHLEKVRKG